VYSFKKNPTKEGFPSFQTLLMLMRKNAKTKAELENVATFIDKFLIFKKDNSTLGLMNKYKAALNQLINALLFEMAKLDIFSITVKPTAKKIYDQPHINLNSDISRRLGRVLSTHISERS